MARIISLCAERPLDAAKKLKNEHTNSKMVMLGENVNEG